MKIRSFSSALLLIAFSLLFVLSCKKNLDDDSQPTPEPGQPFSIPAASPVTGSITGMVVDEHNTPVNGASVSFGSTTANSDARGMFHFDHVVLDKYITTVTVNKAGYFKAFRSFSATASRNFVNIKLIPKTLGGTITGNAAGTITLTNGTKIDFLANSIIVKATGAAYTGTVNVFASYIDPTSTDISATVPGSFVGRDASNLYALQSTGMIAVNLESPAGEPLQLATASTAGIKLPIPASLLAKAPATIDTWSLNDQGIWQKEGTATKAGDYYQMQVSHFSFWNCDVPANAVYLTLHVQDQSSNALANMVVSLTVPGNTSWWATTYGITDSAGNVSGLVPANETLTFNAYPNVYNCSNPVNTQSIGPFTTNASLTVTATVLTSQTLTISGTANNCSNQPLVHGTAIIYADLYGYSYVPVINGSYTATTIHCSPIAAVSVTVISDSTGAQASSGAVTVSGNSVTVPVLTVCGGTPNSVFSFGGGTGICQVQNFTGTYTAGVPLTGANMIGIGVNVTNPGAYSITSTTVDGISFSASGVFTNAGQQTVFLVGAGTPLTSGAFTLQTQSGSTTGCSVIIQVSPAPLPPSVFSFGGSPGPCTGATIAGNYDVGVPLSAGNTIAINVNVTTAGSYSITTGNPINGMQFSDSGNFAVTGSQIVLLHGSGNPANVGSYTFTPQSPNAGTGCTISINTTNSASNAVYSFLGAPGGCTGVSVGGPFPVNVAMNTAWDTMSLVVDVTLPGNYSISTGTVNNFGFSGSGVFTSTGTQRVRLSGFGTPALPGVYTFIPTGNNSPGCSFTAQIN